MTRTCTNPAPANGGATCNGDTTKLESCNTQACAMAIKGGWTAWASDGPCSKKCGNGSQTMTRTCTNPTPANGGFTCSGRATKSNSCNIEVCDTKTNSDFDDNGCVATSVSLFGC
eukprot:Awhi_evm3s1031